MSYSISTTWSYLRTIVDDKHLPIQYKYDSDGYNIFAIDNDVTYQTVIYNNSVPDPSLYSQAQNDSDKSDFLANYQANANHVMQAFAARDGYTTNVYPLLQGGTDNGGIVRIFRADTSRNQVFVGAGTAGTPSGGVLTVQGDPAGTLLPISDGGGSITVDGTVAVSSVSGNVTVVQPTASALNAQVQGVAADGTAVTGNPVLIGGQDGTNVQSIFTDTTGRQVMVGAAADGAAVTGNPVLMAGQDGTNAQSLATDGYGALVVTGKNATGTPPTQNPVVVGGWDGTNVVRLRLNADGTISTSEKELATFTAVSSSTAIGNNKSMFSIVNASGSTVTTKISAIYVTSVQTTAVTGVFGTFELRRITNHSAGTTITAIETLDSSDSLNGSVTVRTGSTVTSESANLLWRSIFSTDEMTANATLDNAFAGHIFTTMFPVWNRRDRDNKPIVLRANEGLTVKFATNSTAGTFDIMVVFTQE